MSGITKVSQELVAASRLLDELGTADRVWPPDMARAVLADLRGKGVAVLGGDVYEVKDGRAAPTYDSWHCDPGESEPFDVYAERSLRTASEYLGRYPLAGRSLLIGLVLAEAGQLPGS